MMVLVFFVRGINLPYMSAIVVEMLVRYNFNNNYVLFYLVRDDKSHFNITYISIVLNIKQ